MRLDMPLPRPIWYPERDLKQQGLSSLLSPPVHSGTFFLYIILPDNHSRIFRDYVILSL